jgi:talin
LSYRHAQCEGREGTWLNPTLSLHENGVPENAVLILKKKFFFSDANIDRSDPVQLHLLYIQVSIILFVFIAYGS